MKEKESDRNCTLPYCSSCQGVYKLFGICVLLIVVYYFYRVSNGRNVIDDDPMNRKVIDIPWLDNCCSWWPLSHFAFFFLIGYLFPDCEVLAIGGGILWELVEVILHYTNNIESQPMRTNSGVEYSQNWWAGSAKDILMNTLGFFLGRYFVRHVTQKRVCWKWLHGEKTCRTQS